MNELPICEVCGGRMDNEAVGFGQVGTSQDPKWQITKHHCVEDVTVEELDDLMRVIGVADDRLQRRVERELRKRYHPDTYAGDKMEALNAAQRIGQAFGDLRNQSAQRQPANAPTRKPHTTDDPEWEAWKRTNGFDQPAKPRQTTPLDDLSDFIPEHMRHQRQQEPDVDTSLGAFVDAFLDDAIDAKRRLDGFLGRLRNR